MKPDDLGSAEENVTDVFERLDIYQAFNNVLWGDTSLNYPYQADDGVTYQTFWHFTIVAADALVM